MRDADELDDAALHRQDILDNTGPFPVDNPAQAERTFDRLMEMWKNYTRQAYGETDEEYQKRQDERNDHD